MANTQQTITIFDHATTEYIAEEIEAAMAWCVYRDEELCRELNPGKPVSKFEITITKITEGS